MQTKCRFVNICGKKVDLDLQPCHVNKKDVTCKAVEW
jgi:hypothetical protein